MPALGDRDDDFFDFREQVNLNPDPQPQQPFLDFEQSATNDSASEVQTSYVLVNALLKLLVQKEIITTHEIQPLVAELHAEYMKKKGRGQ
ncbi:hypothetical protein ACWA2C_16260 [Priestia megaterium]